MAVLRLQPFKVSPKLKANSLTRRRGSSVTQVLNTSPKSFHTNLYTKFCFNNLKGCVWTIFCFAYAASSSPKSLLPSTHFSHYLGVTSFKKLSLGHPYSLSQAELGTFLLSKHSVRPFSVHLPHNSLTIRGFPGGPGVIKTPHFHCRGHRVPSLTRKLTSQKLLKNKNFKSLSWSIAHWSVFWLFHPVPQLNYKVPWKRTWSYYPLMLNM